ncbi:MAG: hypothetical protein ACNA77_08885 [Opitutales bacterium]
MHFIFDLISAHKLPIFRIMRLTRQERISLSVLLVIFLFACIGWLIF